MKIFIKKQNGSVSLFIVVFAALLITIVSVSFVSIMVQNQQQASNVDLSQSAYDSAQAGVEDAKRALLRYQACAGSTDSGCVTLVNNFINNYDKCNSALEGLTGVSVDANGEVKIQVNNTGNSLDQAYTCVKIRLETDDYLGTMVANDSKLIPLKGASTYSKIRLQWFASSDLNTGSFAVDRQPFSATPLLAQSSWPINRPPIMQVQLIQFGNSFTLYGADSLESSANNDTLFLYPSTGGGNITTSPISFLSDLHKTPTANPQSVTCVPSLASGGYACSVDLILPTQTSGGDRTAFLRIRALYNKASFSVSLMDAANNVVKFSGVQTEIDSTGRANDLFRRVQARVELTDMNFPYPEAAVDVGTSFCKDFSVTDNPDDYSSSPICN